MRIEDAKGNLCPSADNLVQFAVTGAGEIAGVDNGNAATIEPFQADHRKAFSGMALLDRALPRRPIRTHLCDRIVGGLDGRRCGDYLALIGALCTATLAPGGSMPENDHGDVRPRTAVLSRGFDPHLSLGSARPAVFRSSTYVFEDPESAEHAFAVLFGKIPAAHGERADLIYSRFSHPNAEILEDQIVPLEAGATDAAVFNSGMAAIMTAFFTFRASRQHHRLHDAALWRHYGVDPHLHGTFRRTRRGSAFGRCRCSG